MKTTPQTPATVGQTLHRVGQCLYRSTQSDKYYAILKSGRKQIKKSLKTADQALAKRRLADLKEKVSRISTDEHGREKFSELGERWLHSDGPSMKLSSLNRQEGLLRNLNRTFGGSRIRSITKTDVARWAFIRSKEIAARTFNYERQTLIRIFNFALRDGLILENPAANLKQMKLPRHRIVIPTKEEFQRLIKAMRALRDEAQEGANLCELLAYSGCRLAEATNMLWGDVDFAKKSFTVTGGEKGTKNHEVRVVPLFPALDRFLQSMTAMLDQPPRPTERIVTIDSAKKGMQNACNKAGLSHFTHHHLRHFFCSNAIEAGVDFKTIAGWLGHKDGGILVARTYGHLRDEHSAAMAQRMTFGTQMGE